MGLLGTRKARRAGSSPTALRAFKATAIAGFAAAGVLVALPAAAQQQPTGITFCGCGAACQFGTQADSIWQAVKSFETATQTPVFRFNRNCLFCHHTNSFGGADSGAPIKIYINSAFEINLLEDWLKSSYWAPGMTKAYAVWKRMELKTMPPGKWPDDLWNTPEPAHGALWDKVKKWQEQQLVYCAQTFAETDPQGELCVWGNMVTQNGQTCSWGQ
jgi:hypothetical protein